MGTLTEKSLRGVHHAGVKRILLIDDHTLVAETVAAVISMHKDFEIVTCATLVDACSLIEKEGRFDVVLQDFNIPGTDGYAALSMIISANSGGVAVFSGAASRNIVERALALGASGFIPKTLPLVSLMNAIRFISVGETYLPSQYISGALHAVDSNSILKRIEMKVLMQLCEGLPNKEIAVVLDLSEPTVKMHVKAICTKLGARNRTQAVLVAQREQLCQTLC